MIPSFKHRWSELPSGARAALRAQWAGVAAGALPCGAAITDADGIVVATGRNHAYDRPGSQQSDDEPLQFTRLAHAEINALARLATDRDHSDLTVWATQHPCAMCAAAIAFTGIRRVVYLADDLSDHAPMAVRNATRSGVPYTAFRDPLWWTVSNLLFTYGSVVANGPTTGTLFALQSRLPRLADLTLELTATDELGCLARTGSSLSDALSRLGPDLIRIAQDLSGQSKTAPGAEAPQDG